MFFIPAPQAFRAGLPSAVPPVGRHLFRDDFQSCYKCFVFNRLRFEWEWRHFHQPAKPTLSVKFAPDSPLGWDEVLLLGKRKSAG